MEARSFGWLKGGVASEGADERDAGTPRDEGASRLWALVAAAKEKEQPAAHHAITLQDARVVARTRTIRRMTTESRPARPGVDYFLIERADLTDSEFQGREYGGTGASVIFVDNGLGEGPKLHRHPYSEIFVMLQGQATYTVGATPLEVRAGQTVVVSPGVPHKFVSTGSERLRQVDIHLSDHFITEWLED
jgi:mannose-6-phosphate isomerase-like protein (cupin superfamily)